MAKFIFLRPSQGLHAFNRSRQFSGLCNRTAVQIPDIFPTAPCTALRAPLVDHKHRPFFIRAIESSPIRSREHDKAFGEEGDTEDGATRPLILPMCQSKAMASIGSGDYPTGEFEMMEHGWWMKAMVKLRMLFALPWERVKKGSVLSMKLRGRITEQLTSRFSAGVSLPQLCENFIKAAYDPRISGIYLHIEPLSCGWGKIDEIRRHILNFKKSGKFTVSYISICGEKEYYLACACEEVYAPPSAYVALYGSALQASFLGGVFEKVGVEPQIQRIGKYKSAGDQLTRKNMSKETREMLTSLLDDIYGNWLETISSTQGKTTEEIEEFINSGVYQVEKLKENGWITDSLYDDEVLYTGYG